MKRILVCLSALVVFVFSLLVVSGCSSGSPPGPTAASPVAVTVRSLSISGTVSFNAVGQTTQLSAIASMSDGSSQNVTSSSVWQSSNAAVATVSASGVVTSRGAGDSEISATYQGARAATTARVTLPVTCTFSLTPSTQRFRPEGGSGSVGVSASASSCTWTATSTASWLRITGGASGTGSGTVSISADAHTARDDRIGHVDIAGQRAEVRQDGVGDSAPAPPPAAACWYSLTSPKDVRVGAASSGTFTITFDQTTGSACVWTATTAEPWLQVLDAGGVGSIRIRVAYSAFPGGSREGIVRVRWNGPQEGENIRVVQAGS